MEKNTKIKFALLIAFIATLFIVAGCAHQVAPTGGPADKEPPEIIAVYPPEGSVNYNENIIQLEFSEYVNKSSLQEAVFVSPALEHPLEFDWYGKAVEIVFKDTLKENRTYTFTIGTDLEDLNNNNKMAEAYTLTFSTGDQIDTCGIRGEVFAKNPAGIMIFAFHERGDTVGNPLTDKPDYVSQVGSKGDYSLTGLSTGKYRVFAVKDEFKDLLYNVEEDLFSAPRSEVVLSGDAPEYRGLNFILTREDTTEPHIAEITMTDRNHILVEFNEAIDSAKLSKDNFFIFDSTGKTTHHVDYFTKGKGTQNKFFLNLKDSLNEEGENYLSVSNVLDKSGNRLHYESAFLAVNAKKDTSYPVVLKTNTEYENNVVDFSDPYILFSFDDGIDYSKFQKNIRPYNKKADFPFAVKRITDSDYRVELGRALESKEEFSIDINMKNLPDIAGNVWDSVLTYKFKGINELDFSGVSGKLISKKDSLATAIVVLENSENPSEKYTQKGKDDLTFEFKRVKPGKYILWSFCDKNNDGKYSSGKIKPFETAEEFYFYPDTLNLRARWPVGDVVIDCE